MGCLQTINISGKCANELFLAQQIILINLFKTENDGVAVLILLQFNLLTLFLLNGCRLIVIIISQWHL